jgi:hypothetical protein
MNQREKNRESLQEAINSMSMHTAPDGLWDKIGNNLEQATEVGKENLEKAIVKLPEQKLEYDLWVGISEQLDERKTIKLKPNKNFYKIAAAFLLFIATIGLVVKQAYKSSDFEISIEIIEEQFIEKSFETFNDPTIQNEIDLLCSHLPEHCNDPLIQELKEQLEEVNLQYKKLKTIMATENNPELRHYLLRIENEKTEIEKELLNVIINS